MIGKSGARQEINNYLSEIEYFIKREKSYPYDDILHWQEKANDHIRLALHIIDTYDDSKVEAEQPDYRDGLKFTYIRRGYGEEGAQIEFHRGGGMLKLSFWTNVRGKTASLTYEKDEYMVKFFFRPQREESIYREREIE